jgi:hypothetical protein
MFSSRLEIFKFSNSMVQFTASLDSIPKLKSILRIITVSYVRMEIFFISFTCSLIIEYDVPSYHDVSTPWKLALYPS